jgi:hypothetical protein
MKPSEIFNHPITKNYIKSCKKMSCYHQIQCIAPKDIMDEYHDALYYYHQYFDSLGIDCI